MDGNWELLWFFKFSSIFNTRRKNYQLSKKHSSTKVQYFDFIHNFNMITQVERDFYNKHQILLWV